MFFLPRNSLNDRCWQKNVYLIYPLNLHLQLWNQFEPRIYNNKQDNNLYIPVETLLNAFHSHKKLKDSGQ